MIEQLRQARPQARFLELVHRLDRETSGILLIAKKRSALRHIQDQFRERSTGKTYLALVKGAWPVRNKVLDQPLHKYLLPDGERRVSVVPADHPDGMRSVTLVQLQAQFPIPLRPLPHCRWLQFVGCDHQNRADPSNSRIWHMQGMDCG